MPPFWCLQRQKRPGRHGNALNGVCKSGNDLADTKTPSTVSAEAKTAGQKGKINDGGWNMPNYC